MDMKKTVVKIAVGLVMVTLLAGCSKDDTSKKDDKELVVAMELAYPPFETKDSEGNPSGVSVDFAKAFGAYIGKIVKIENTAWDGLIPSLQTGKSDMVVSSMTITEERKETVDFSDPYANSLLAVLANKESGVKSIEDLNQGGKKVAVKTGSTGYLYAKEHLKNAEIIALADESACITEVSQGKADGFLYDQLTIYRNWQQYSDTTEAIFIPFQEVDKWGVAVQKGNTQLLDQLNEFIKKYTKEGGFDDLTQKYLEKEKAAFDEFGFKWFFDIGE